MPFSFGDTINSSNIKRVTINLGTWNESDPTADTFTITILHCDGKHHVVVVCFRDKGAQLKTPMDESYLDQGSDLC